MSIPDKLPPYKIISTLGAGLNGTVYKVKVKNKLYALKIQKIQAKHVKENFKSKVWREIDFAKNFISKNPEYFDELHAYEIFENCEHEQKADEKTLEGMGTSWQADWKKNQDSKYCAAFLYEYIEGITFDEYYQTTGSYKGIYSLIAQIAQAHKQMNEAGYVLLDTHTQNMMVVEEKKERKIQIGKHTIKTKVRIKLIDYSDIVHTKYKLSKIDRDYLKYGNSFYSILGYFWDEKIERKKGIMQIKADIDFDKLINNIEAQPEYKWLIKDCFPNKNKNAVDYCGIEGLYKTMNRELYYTMCGYGEIVKDLDKYIDVQKLSNSDFICLYRYVRDFDAITEYFCEKVF